MKKILIFMGRYLPGYKDGGPVRSTKNLIDQLGKEYDIRVACYDRDAGDTEQYPNIKLYDWNQVGNGLVYYVPELGFTDEILIDLAEQVDILYLWGCFNLYSRKILFLKRIGKIKKPVVIAGMGLFSPMAFKMKYRKKKIFTTLLNITGMFKDVYWSATSEMEVKEIKRQIWVKDRQFYIAEDLPRKVDSDSINKIKQVGSLNIVWISRIAPKKNLLAAIRILKNVTANVSFTIYGPIYDNEYWDECKVELQTLPKNIKWNYCGNVESEMVVEVLKKHQVFLFPTFGENYGHVIQEALSAGCPCILSDQTPWQDLRERKVGYVIPLDEENEYVNAIEEYASMDQRKWDENVRCALQYAIDNSNMKVETTGYRKIFDEL